KCGVWPRITTPTQAIARYRPLRARWLAAWGSSKEPGTQWTSMSFARMPAAEKAWVAPSTSRLVIRSLKRAATTANRVFSPRRRGARPAMSGQRGEEVPELVALRAQVPVVVRRGRRLDGDALDDLQAVRFEAHPLLRVVREQAQVLHAQIDEDLSTDPVVALV